MAGMERRLLRLGKEIIGIAVERHLANLHDRHEFFRNDLGGIEEIKAEFMLVRFFNNLESQLPFGKVAALYRFPQIAPVEIRVFAGDQLRFLPDQRTHALKGLPVKLNET